MRATYSIYIVALLCIFHNATMATATVKSAAGARGILVGTAVRGSPSKWEKKQRDTLTNEFSLVTPENAMKFAATQPAPDKFTFGQADELMTFAVQHNLAVRGHTLLWHEGLPRWLERFASDKEKLKRILQRHIKTVVEHFRDRFPGKIKYWDVVNEAITAEGFRESIWSGIDESPLKVIDNAFRWAHEADTKVQLFYNEFGVESKGPKSENFIRLLKALKSSNTPIQGVGLQLHLSTDTSDTDYLAPLMSEIAKLELDIHITELDVAIPKKSTTPLPTLLKQQASIYASVARACITTPRCKVLSVWGLADHLSWIPEHSRGTRWKPLLFDENFRQKPAYLEVEKVFQQHKI